MLGLMGRCADSRRIPCDVEWRTQALSVVVETHNSDCFAARDHVFVDWAETTCPIDGVLITESWNLSRRYRGVFSKSHVNRNASGPRLPLA